LLIVSSYSGNTEESLSVFRQGLQAGCSIVCITTGGTAANIAKENDLPVFPLRSGYQPRYAFGASFFSLLKVFQLAGLINDQSATVQRVIDIWKKRGEEFTRENNFAYQMARQLIGFVPVIIAVADVNESLAVRMKSQFNENSKMHAFASIFPEHNHNEIIAWETFAPDQMNAATILFNDPDYHPQVKKRIEIVMKLIEKAGCPIITLSSLEKDHKTRMCELIYLGDWITYYSAILRGKDPGEIDYIHYLKNRLAE
jgi:glucose/mannose-6-phosphate isomerase